MQRFFRLFIDCVRWVRWSWDTAANAGHLPQVLGTRRGRGGDVKKRRRYIVINDAGFHRVARKLANGDMQLYGWHSDRKDALAEARHRNQGKRTV